MGKGCKVEISVMGWVEGVVVELGEFCGGHSTEPTFQGVLRILLLSPMATTLEAQYCLLGMPRDMWRKHNLLSSRYVPMR